VSNLYGSPQGEALAQRIVDVSFADTVFFTNSGVEAIECAIKTARRFHFVDGNPQRHKLITFKNAFHGRSLGAISATDQTKMRDGFEPLLPGFDYAKFNDLEGALALIDDETAGFLVETVQGEGGMTAGTPAFIQGLRKACDEYGLLLILDEIQCGYGRTGKMWAYEHYGITPDIMTVAKGIGGGFPLGACLATEDAAKGMVAGTHGSTYGGNPLAMAAGQAVLDVMLEPDFLPHVAAMGDRLRASFEQLIPNHDHLFEEIRGKGLMLGIKMKESAVSRDFVAHLRDNHGLLTVAAGENVFRVLPPLVIDESHIAECVERLSAGAASYALPVAA
jgi:acetylornithine/N-succinyldiaminopimelate aminotransferase